MGGRIELNQKNLDRVIHWISVADSKATTLLAIWAIAATGFGATVQTVARGLPPPQHTLGTGCGGRPAPHEPPAGARAANRAV